MILSHDTPLTHAPSFNTTLGPRGTAPPFQTLHMGQDPRALGGERRKLRRALPDSTWSNLQTSCHITTETARTFTRVLRDKSEGLEKEQAQVFPR